MSSTKLKITGTVNNYGIQPLAQTPKPVISTTSTTAGRLQGPGSARSNTGKATSSVSSAGQSRPVVNTGGDYIFSIVAKEKERVAAMSGMNGNGSGYVNVGVGAGVPGGPAVNIGIKLGGGGVRPYYSTGVPLGCPRFGASFRGSPSAITKGCRVRFRGLLELEEVWMPMAHGGSVLMLRICLSVENVRGSII